MDFIEVKLNDVKKELVTVLADEIIGMTVEEPAFKLIFCAQIKDYTPGVVIKAVSKTETKYLVYSPLMGLTDAVSDGLFLDITEIGKTYHANFLNAEIIGEPAEIGLILYHDKVEGNICSSPEQAMTLIKAYLAMADYKWRGWYYTNCYKREIRNEVIPVYVNDVLYWFLPHLMSHGLYCGFLVNVANSIVTYGGIRQEDLWELKVGRRYHSKAYKACPSQRYLYNGKVFSAVRDNSRLLTMEEAKGCYANIPAKDKARYANYKDRGFVPVMVLNEFHYLIAESCDTKKPAVLLMNSQDGNVVKFDYKLSENVKYISLGTYFENEGCPVTLTDKGWESK